MPFCSPSAGEAGENGPAGGGGAAERHVGRSLRALAGCLRRRFSCFCKKIDKKQPQGGADRCLLPPQSRGIYGAIATGNRFQKPKWSSIPRQCAHWHGMSWSWGCSRRKRRNPASLYQVRAGRILKEGGLVCGSKPFSASLSRILSPFLGGTRKGPPEGFPAQSFDKAFDKPNLALFYRRRPLG